MNRIIKFPTAMVTGDYTASSLVLDGGSVISKARQMLQASQMSVADVAYSLGFENPTHFSRIFKQQYGMPPSSLANR